MYFYNLLDELKKYYPSLKEIHRTEIYNTPIYPKDIEVCCKDKTIAITVKYGYTSTSFNIPNLSEIYSAIVSERYEIYRYLLLTTGKVSFAFDYCKSDAFDAIYGISESLKELEKKYKKYVVTRPSTENDSKEKATVKYGYSATCDSFGIPKLLELYSSMYSEYSKLLNHLYCIPDNSNEKIKELKEKINSVFGVPTFEDFDKITDELKDTYIKKNHDYGNSFDKSIDKFGLTAAVVRMNDKMERLNSLLNKDAKVDESIRDTVMDLANYCIMTAMYLDNKKEKK